MESRQLILDGVSYLHIPSFFFLTTLSLPTYTRVLSNMAKHSLIYLCVALLFTLLLGPQGSDATALTYNLAANENACFYIWADKPGKKLGFYFAVSWLTGMSVHDAHLKGIGSTRWFI